MIDTDDQRPELGRPYVTVAIPTYRREQVLLETLDHLMALQVRADEILWS